MKRKKGPTAAEPLGNDQLIASTITTTTAAAAEKNKQKWTKSLCWTGQYNGGGGGARCYDFWLAGLHDEREPPSDVGRLYIVARPSSPAAHTQHRKGAKKNMAESQTAMRLDFVHLVVMGPRARLLFSSTTTGLSSIRGSSSLSAFIYLHPGSVYRLPCRVVGGLYRVSLFILF